jgi:hypothetical protein
MPMIKGPELYKRKDGARKNIVWHDIVIFPDEMRGGSVNGYDRVEGVTG